MKPFATLPASNGDNEEALPHLENVLSSFAVSVLDSSPDCIKLIELDGRLSYMNKNGLCAMEIDNFCDVEDQPWPSLWPQEAQAMLQAAVEDAALGSGSEFEAYCPTAKKADRWWNVCVSPVRDSNGKVERILATSRDISDKVLHERALQERDLQLQSYAETLSEELQHKEKLLKQQEVLAGEADHRVKNSFALISGMLRLQMREMQDSTAKEALSDSANRISTLSRVHDQLHCHPESRDVALPNFLGSLVDDLEASLTDGAKVELGEVFEITVTAERAVAIGLVVAELVGNALRHGREGQPVSVEISVSPAEQPEWLDCCVRDDGEGLPETFEIAECSGLGMKICSIYSDQIGGDISAGSRPDGTGAEFRLSFPKVEPDA